MSDIKKHELLSKGIYCIINKKLNLVYVGQTQRTFLLRFTEHIMRISKYQDDSSRVSLFLDKQTQFLVLKTLDDPHYKMKDFFEWEYKAYQFYKEKNWGILSTHQFNADKSYPSRSLEQEKVNERYRKSITHMAHMLATKNTNHNNSSLILSKLYNQLDRTFSTNVRERGGKTVISTLTQSEMEFMMLELFHRFKEKSLELLRQEANSNK